MANNEEMLYIQQQQLELERKKIANEEKRQRQAENDRANREGKAARAAETAAIDAEMRSEGAGYTPFTTGGATGGVPSFEEWKKNKTNEEREAGPTRYEEWKAQQPGTRDIMTSAVDPLGKRTPNTLGDVDQRGHRGGGVSNEGTRASRYVTDAQILSGRPLGGPRGPTGLYPKRVNYPGQGVEVSPHPTGLGGVDMSYGGPKYQEHLEKEGRPPTRGEGLSIEDEKWPLEDVLETIDEAAEAGFLSRGHAMGMKKEVLSGRPGARASVVKRLQELVRLKDVRRPIN